MASALGGRGTDEFPIAGSQAALLGLHEHALEVHEHVLVDVLADEGLVGNVYLCIFVFYARAATTASPISTVDTFFVPSV